MLYKTILLISLLILSSAATANGVLRNGIGTRAMSLGGGGLVFPDDTFTAATGHPAALGNFRENVLAISVTAAFLDAEFSNRNTTDADGDPGVFPDFTYIWSPDDRFSLGASLAPLSALEADWRFIDPAGSLGITYGSQTHRSSFIALRGALGIGFQVNPQFSIGGNIGVIYNRNRLQAPYVFQSHPVLAGALGGAKVLANLETEGFGVNGVISVLIRPTNTTEISLAYTTPTNFDTDGTLRGTDRSLLGLGDFSYDAEVKTRLPRVISGAFGWQINDTLKVGLQLEWIDWDNAFDRLPIMLANGNNATLNSLAGSNRIDDVAALDWKDTLVFRTGGEYKWSDKLYLRAGYSFGDSPVPSETLTATTAAITRHTLTMGTGYQFKDYTIDIGYQWDLPTSDTVGKSRLLAGEYNNSEIDVSIHWLSIAVTFNDWL